MKRKSIPPFYGVLTIGLEIGYEKVEIDKTEIITFIQAYQDELIKNKQIYLSASIANCTIVLSGQVEPHLTISFINYPKFELPPAVLKFEIEELSNQLLLAFKQNRVVIEYLEEVIMLENSDEIDPRIQQ
jgi:hypothetical protein